MKTNKMKLLIGLGNPGEEYKDSRHNAGQIFVDSLRSTVYGSEEWRTEKKFNAVVCRLKSIDIILAKPILFMNESGTAVKKLVDFYKVLNDDLYVAYDDLDIPLGSYKISKGKSPRVHNGVNFVIETLGTEDFWHVRIGIDNRVKEQESIRAGERPNGKEYVLQDFSAEERKTLDEVLGRIANELANNHWNNNQ